MIDQDEDGSPIPFFAARADLAALAARADLADLVPRLRAEAVGLLGQLIEMAE